MPLQVLSLTRWDLVSNLLDVVDGESLQVLGEFIVLRSGTVVCRQQTVRHAHAPSLLPEEMPVRAVGAFGQGRQPHTFHPDHRCESVLRVDVHVSDDDPAHQGILRQEGLSCKLHARGEISSALRHVNAQTGDARRHMQLVEISVLGIVVSQDDDLESQVQ